MRSESATVNGRSFLRPCAVFLFRHTSRLGGTRPGTRFVVTKEGMQYRDCNSIADVVREVFDLIRKDRSCLRENDVSYYFRGESHNYECEGSDNVPQKPQRPSIYYEGNNWIAHESDFFNEALRTYPEEFSRDKSTFEILTRMQHYGYPTRLMDVTSKLATAIGIVISKGYEGVDYQKRNGFIHVYRVKNEGIKYGTSDTVTALSNIARLKQKRFLYEPGGLRYLGAECKNERAGFFIEEGCETTKSLRRDLKKVFCVKPMVNNIRANFQLGEFFLFGCNDKKKCLDATFSEADYDNESAATEGIARIGIITLTSRAKEEAHEMSDYLDIGEHRLYPDFWHHSRHLMKIFKT